MTASDAEEEPSLAESLRSSYRATADEARPTSEPRSCLTAVINSTVIENPHNLQRFVDAQAPVYEHALAELRAGRKRSH